MAANGGLPDGALIEIVNDDMPFLVNSVLGELQARGIGVRLLLHPIFKTRRDKAGRLQDVARVGDDKVSDGHQESYIAVHIKALPEPEARDLADTLSAILDEVRVVVADWKPLLGRLEAAMRQLEMAPDSVPRDLLAEFDGLPRMARTGQLYIPGVARARARRAMRKPATLPPSRAAGSACCATPACRCCAAAPSWWP